MIKLSAESLPDRFVRLELLIAGIERRFGSGKLMRLAEQFRVRSPETISSGLLSLDHAVGGGIPRGRVTEIYGPEGSGKTTLALQVIAEAQANGGVAAYIDAECALAPEYVKLLGVRAADLYVSQPDSGEQAIEIVEALLRSKCFDVIVIDSVAALDPRAVRVADGGRGDRELDSRALHASLISRALRKLCGLTYRSRTALILLNQLRIRFGPFGRHEEITTGGRAVNNYASLRLELRPLCVVRDSQKAIGTRVRVRVAKNKLAVPGLTTEFEIHSEEGVCKTGELFDLSVGHGIIRRRGEWFILRGARLGATRDGVINEIKTNETLRVELRRELSNLL